MGKRLLSFLVICLCAVSLAFAQKTVTGTVVDEMGEPVVGASVLVKGTQVGVATDLNGKFSIKNVPNSATSLMVSYIGMKTKEVTIKSGVKVVLVSEANSIDDVMVIAYGTAKKYSFTGSAASVDSKKLELRPVTNVSKGLEGQVTGVQTTSGSGQPGSGSSIVIRGIGSINASSSPLYVVDGVPYDGNISSLNPADVESMTVLKDASAGALYGARGANGVILITTKKGKEGRPQITWRSTIGGSSRALPAYDMLDAKEYVQMNYEALRNEYAFNGGYSWADAETLARNGLGGLLGGEQYNPFKNYSWNTIIDPATGLVNADAQAAWDEKWMDNLLVNNALRHEHQFNINGGTEKTKYNMSLAYLNEDGILKTTNFERYNGRAGVDSQVNDWFAANANISLSTSGQNFSQYDGSSTSNPWYSSQFVSPLFPVYLRNLDGSLALDAEGNKQFDYGDATGRPGSYTDFNPLGGLMLDKSDVKTDAASIRTGLVFGGNSPVLGVFKGLKLNIGLGADYRTQTETDFMNSMHGNQANAGGLMEKYATRTLSYTFNQLLTYNRTFGKHGIDVLAGHEFYSYKYNYLYAAKSNIVEGIMELRPGTTILDADSYSHNYRIESWLGRVNYNYNEKYYLSASLRTDASSRFHKDYRWGTFWSVGANWRISEENFLKNADWLDNLSLKASYGEQGNDAVGTYYAWQSLYSLAYANANNKGALIGSLENREISWEKNGNLNVGVEASFFNGRLTASLEYFHKKTFDMLLNYPMALSTGFDGYDANVGDMKNYGFEFDLRAVPVRTRDFEWGVSVMGTAANNKVVRLTKESPELLSGVRIIKEGYPINTYYVSKTAGVDPSTGQLLYWAYDKDDNGDMVPGSERITTDYTEANNSRYFMGSRMPKLFGSVGTDLTWKGITLSVLTTYSIGGKVFDGLYASSMEPLYSNTNWHKNVLRRWQQPGDITDVPRAEINPSTASYQDRFLINASYFSIKNITLGYQLPKSWMQAAKLAGVRVFGSVDNLATFGYLNGMNPTYNFSGGTDYVYVPTKTWSVGLEVNF